MKRSLKLLFSSLFVLLVISSFTINPSTGSNISAPNYLTEDTTKAEAKKAEEPKKAKKAEEKNCRKSCQKTCGHGTPSPR